MNEEHNSRDSVAALIESWGGMVDKVGIAAEAVEALGQQDYDAVMIDDAFDGTYGDELARVIKDMDIGDTTIIIATEEPVNPKLEDTPVADQCIEKPLKSENLLPSLLKSGKFSVTH